MREILNDGVVTLNNYSVQRLRRQMLARMLALAGVSLQTTYTGKNLFNYYEYPENVTYNGVAIVNNGDGTITLNGTCTANNTGFLLGPDMLIKDIVNSNNVVQTAEYISGTCTKISSSSTRTVIRLNYDTGTDKMIRLDELQAQTIISKQNPQDSRDSSWSWRISLDSGDSFDNFTFRYQVEKGTEFTGFEPYVGGISSPNPEYPQDISSITGDVKIVGKNLWTFSNTSYNNASSSTWRDIEGNTAYGRYLDNCKGIYLDAGTYTISVGSTTNIASIIQLVGLDETVFANNLNPNAPRSFSLEEKTFVIVRGRNSEINIETKIINIQIERGSIATSYKPYKEITIPLGITELCKISNVADKLVIDTKTGIVSKVNKISKYIYTGDESITLQHSNDNGVLFNIKQPVFPLENYATNYLNNYSIANSSSASNKADIGSYIFNGTYRIRVPNSIATTAEEFVTWLATANNTIYYPLATTTTETITTLTAEQLTTLKAIAKEGKLKATTNIGIYELTNGGAA